MIRPPGFGHLELQILPYRTAAASLDPSDDMATPFQFLVAPTEVSSAHEAPVREAARSSATIVARTLGERWRSKRHLWDL